MFKLEYEADNIISLCLKKYRCFWKYNKASNKELNKAQNDLKKEYFIDVLENTKRCGGTKN